MGHRDPDRFYSPKEDANLLLLYVAHSREEPVFCWDLEGREDPSKEGGGVGG